MVKNIQSELVLYSKVKDLDLVKEEIKTKCDFAQFEELYNYVNAEVYKNEQAGEFAEVIDVKLEEIRTILGEKCN